MNIVIMAAGKGTRMRSQLPKVLHPLAGQPILAHVLDTARQLNAHQSAHQSEHHKIIVIVGYGAESVTHAFKSQTDLQFVLQDPPQGTGHAVLQAVPYLDDSAPTLILNGDVPLTELATLQKLVAAQVGGNLALLTVNLPDPTGYGRIMRGTNGAIEKIVEQKDASETEKNIHEIYSGLLCAPTAPLKKWLAQLQPNNAQKEYYLTDIVALAKADGVAIRHAQPQHTWEVDGINSRAQLAALERVQQLNTAQQLMENGVTLADPARLDVRGTLHCAADVNIDVGCVFEGNVTIETGAHIGAYCVVINSYIKADAQIQAYSHIDGATVGVDNKIGPYARLRPGAVLAEDVHIGNFVEVKNSTIAAHSKANHLAYVGDSEVGSRVNIGAGTITCNYDGANKHKTVIEDDVFIGSDTQLVAPVRVGKGATVGAGATVTKDVPPNTLMVSRAKTTIIEGWKRPVKKQPKGA